VMKQMRSGNTASGSGMAGMPAMPGLPGSFGSGSGRPPVQPPKKKSRSGNPAKRAAEERG
jgi:signal recognition particle subunit SRP54